MIISITGSRTITDYKLLCLAVNESRFDITKIISGGAAGIDSLARVYAYNHSIPFEEYPADWKKFGRRAGPIRNREMEKEIEGAIVLWNGASKGTLDYIKLVQASKKPLYLKQVTNKKYSNNSGQSKNSNSPV